MRRWRRGLIPLISVCLFGLSLSNGQASNGNLQRLKDVQVWEGVCEVEVIGDVENYCEANACNYKSQINRIATFKGLFYRCPDPSGQRCWQMEKGTVTVKINDETYEAGSGSKTRSTLKDDEIIDLKTLIQKTSGWHGPTLTFGTKGYALEFTETLVNAENTYYEPNDPDAIFQGPDTVGCYTNGAKLTESVYPSSGFQLKGSRKVRVPVDPPAGDQVEMEAEFSWNLDYTVEPVPLVK